MKSIFGILFFFSVGASAQTNPFPDDPYFTTCFNNAKTNSAASIANYPNQIEYNGAYFYSDPPYTLEPLGSPVIQYRVNLGIQLPVPSGADKIYFRMDVTSCYHDVYANDPDNRDFVSTNTKITDGRQQNTTNSCGSVIDFNKRTVIESLPIEGTRFSLNYSSEFNNQINANRTIKNHFLILQNSRPTYQVSYVNVASSTLISTVSQSLVTNSITSDYLVPTSAFTANTFVSSATINVNFVGTYVENLICTSYYSGGVSTPVCASPFTYDQQLENINKIVTLFKPEVFGMHGWTVSEHHYFDKYSKKLFKGTGETVEYASYKTVSDVTLGTVNVVISKDDENEMFLFDSNGRHLETRHVILGYVINKFTYDGSNRLTSIADRFNSTTTFTYSGANLQKITSPYGVESNFAITSNRISKMTDAENFEYDMTYDSGTGLLLTYDPPNGVVTTFSYNSDGEFTQESKSNGLLQSFTKTVVDGITELTKSLNFGVDRTVKIEIDRNGVKTNEVDSNNVLISQIENSYLDNVTKFKFNQDTVTQQFSPSSDWGSDKVIVSQEAHEITESSQNVAVGFSFSESRTYTSSNILKPVNYSDQLTISQGYGGIISNSYTKSNTSWAFTNLLGNVTTTKFNASGVVTRISSPDKYPVDFEYDSAGRLIKWKKTNTYYETYGYDTYGYLGTINNSKSQLTQFIRNKKGQILQKILPNSETVNFEYTSGGEVKKITAPNGQVHQFSTSLGDYITQMISPASKTVYYTYDSDKRLDTVTKPSGKTLDYDYEASRNMLSSISTSSGTVLISHDIRGRIASATSADNIQIDMTWASDQIQSQTWYDNGTPVATLSNTFAADQFKIKEIYLDSNLIANYTYSAGVLSGISNLGITYSHSFGTYNHTQTVAGSGISVSYSEIDGSSQPAQTVEGTYYDSSSNSITAYMRRNYDNFEQSTSLVSTKFNGSTSLYDSHFTFTPVYDANNRLTQVTRVRKKYVSGVLTNSTDFVNKYTFPVNSNNNVTGWRQTSGTTTTVTKQTSGTYNIDDQLTQMTGTVSRTYTYTQDGEVSTMVSASGTVTYIYDAFGYLKKATLPGSIVVEYKTDAFNRRFKKLVNGSVTEYYLWYDQTRLAAILDAGKNPKVIYVYGSESTNTPGFVIKSGTTYKIIHDPGTESVRYVVDVSTGVIAQEIDYDEFGNITLNTDTSFQPLGFAGGLFDADTKFVRFGARDYDPVIGRWLTKDPIGFDGGDTNLYAYVGGNPMSYVDPNGLSAFGATLGEGGIGGGSVNPAGGGVCPGGSAVAVAVAGGAAAIAVVAPPINITTPAPTKTPSCQAAFEAGMKGCITAVPAKKPSCMERVIREYTECISRSNVGN